MSCEPTSLQVLIGVSAIALRADPNLPGFIEQQILSRCQALPLEQFEAGQCPVFIYDRASRLVIVPQDGQMDTCVAGLLRIREGGAGNRWARCVPSGVVDRYLESGYGFIAENGRMDVGSDVILDELEQVSFKGMELVR